MIEDHNLSSGDEAMSDSSMRSEIAIISAALKRKYEQSFAVQSDNNAAEQILVKKQRVDNDQQQALNKLASLCPFICSFNLVAVRMPLPNDDDSVMECVESSSLPFGCTANTSSGDNNHGGGGDGSVCLRAVPIEVPFDEADAPFQNMDFALPFARDIAEVEMLSSSPSVDEPMQIDPEIAPHPIIVAVVQHDDDAASTNTAPRQHQDGASDADDEFSDEFSDAENSSEFTDDDDDDTDTGYDSDLNDYVALCRNLNLYVNRGQTFAEYVVWLNQHYRCY